jgi:uncharacterized protein (TIGR03435 family)
MTGDDAVLRRACVAGALGLVLAAPPLDAVMPAGPAPVGMSFQRTPEAVTTGDTSSFEVASIKINKSGDWRVSGGFLPGGRYRVANYALRNLIAAAYLRPQINPDFLISGGPSWIDSERFDIDAKAATDFLPGPDSPAAPRRIMLQRLLADRFGLRVHHETSDRPVYVLVMARADNRLGPQMRRAPVGCAELIAAAAKSGGPAPSCGSQVGPGSVVMHGVPLTILANLLPRFVNRVIIDRTALTGSFDLEIKWTPAPGEWVAPPSPGGAGAPPTDGPSLFSALQEQLGLKLQSTRGPVDILVVDHADMPTEN